MQLDDTFDITLGYAGNDFIYNRQTIVCTKRMLDNTKWGVTYRYYPDQNKIVTLTFKYGFFKETIEGPLPPGEEKIIRRKLNL